MQPDSASRQVIFIADDFGLSEAVNNAILRAHLDGSLHGACLMVGQPGTEHAMELARAHPTLQLGWHLHLCDSQPTTIDAWPWDDSPTRAGLAIAALPRARALVRAEISKQWETLKASGLPIATVNTHHHLHWHPFVIRSLVDTLEANGGFNGWLRWGEPRFFQRSRAPLGYTLVNRYLQTPKRKNLPIRTSATLWGLDRTCAMNPAEIERVLPALPAGLHEFMFHPRPGSKDPDTDCLITLRDIIPRADSASDQFASGSETSQS